MKQHRRGSKGPQIADPEFLEALDYDPSVRSRSRQAERKTQQLCRQVQRALNAALVDGSMDGFFVDAVTPAPDCGRLAVHVAVPAGVAVGEAMALLARESVRLRAEVAMAIARKRTPELSFLPAG